MSYDTEFYLRREQQERAIARLSINPAIAAIHHAMAERYALLAGPLPHGVDEVRTNFPGPSAT